jgi:site-specific recombinase XerD
MVFLSEEGIEAVQAYLSVRGPAASDHVFVFCHRPLSRGYCRQRLRIYGRGCGLRIIPHQLRFSFATLLLNAGVSILTVQHILGHHHVKTTLGYARLYDSTAARDYAQAMGEIERDCFIFPDD